MAGFVKELVDEFARHAFATPEPDHDRDSRIWQLKIIHNLAFVHKKGALEF